MPLPLAQNFDFKSGLRGDQYLIELECLRGVAILLVFFFHAYGISLGKQVGTGNIFLSYIISGNTGVTLFFVLSGFLLSLPWLKHRNGARHSSPNISNYFIARALRIVPLYLAWVLLAIIASGDVLTGLKAAIFLYVGYDIFPYSVVWWTLSTEVQFYLALPLLFWALSHSQLTRILLALLAVTWLALYLDFFVLGNEGKRELSYLESKSLFGRLPAFLIGIASAWVYLNPTIKHLTRDPRWSGKVIATALLIALFTVLGLVLQHAADMGDRKAERLWHIHHTYEALLWAGLMLALLLGRPLGRQLVVNRWLAMIGKLSYSLYLVHVPILFYLIYPYKQTLGADQYIASHWLYIIPAGALLLCLLLSVATYRLIETPFLRLKGNIPRYGSTEQTQKTSEADDRSSSN